jgi:tight adherence protein C
VNRQVVGFAVLFGLGAFLVAVGQPLGRPRPPLLDRLRRLRPDMQDAEEPTHRTALFQSPGLERTLGPVLEGGGSLVLRLRRRAGLPGDALSARLGAAGSGMTAAQFFGQKIAAALVGFALLPVATGTGLIRWTGGAVWVWVALATLGYFGPDLWLANRAEARRREIAWELGGFLDEVTLALSAGEGMEQAVQEAALSGRGPLAAEIRAGLRDLRLTGRPLWERLEVYGEEIRVPELASVGAAIGAAVRQGGPVIQALRAQAEAVRERRRLELLESGERAAVRMLLPVGGLILPAFFVAVLFPAAVQMLGLTHG